MGSGITPLGQGAGIDRLFLRASLGNKPISLPRFTVRRLMLAVAVVAVILGVMGFLARVRTNRLKLATYHLDQRGGVVIESFHVAQNRTIDTYFKPGGEKMTDLEVRMFHWHDALAKKYTQAAETYWLPVEPDPPQPK